MGTVEKIAQPVEEWLNSISYKDDSEYIPSTFALEFVNFIKLVNGGQGEEHKTPVLHYKMLDKVQGNIKNVCNMLFRGSGKTTVMAEYLFLYIGVYGEIPGFGKVPLAMYVSDSIENGVKNMRKNLEYRWENSDFLRHYIPKTRFTDVRWEFNNIHGLRTIIKGYGASTGVRGVKEMGVRPVLAILDDLVSDEDARSPTVISSIEDTVYKAVNYALHPTRNKTIWSGTPFNSRDPLYKAVESGAWYVNLYPVCEQFPCSKEDFRGAWDDRFTYEYVREQYENALKVGKIDTFNQELMLRIMSDEDRLIQDCDISWYKREKVINNKGLFNFYITTDFATSEKAAADFSVISVWAYNNNGDWMWVDGICKRQLMNQNIDDLFRLVSEYHPQQVGVEVSGQQGGFISWIQGEMLTRNIYFTLASDQNGNKPGIRPNTNKMQRFNIMVPLFKLNKIFFPEERKTSPEIAEALNELSLAAANGFRSKHDDFCFSGDTKINMIDGKTKSIKDIEEGDLVMTFGGDAIYMPAMSASMTGCQYVEDYSLSNGEIVTMTDNHPVLTNTGWVRANALTINSLLLKADECKLQNLITNGQEKRQGITSQQSLLKVNVDGYINGFGKKVTVNSLEHMMSTISMKTKIIIHYLTLSYFLEPSTIRSTDLGVTLKKQESIWKEYVLLQKSGMVLKKALNGINSITKIIKISFMQSISVIVSTVGAPLLHTLKIEKYTAVLPVLIKKYKQMTAGIKILFASTVTHLLDGIGIKNAAVVNAPMLSVLKKENRREVFTYNFEVLGTHNYVLAAGLIVHNCDTISMLGSLTPWKPSQVSPKPSDDESKYWPEDIEEAAQSLDSYIV